MTPAKSLIRAAFLAGVLFSGAGCVTMQAGEMDNPPVLTEIFEKAVRYHVSSPAPASLEGKSIDELLDALDPHSAYYTPLEYRQMEQDRQRGQFGGLGLEVTEDESSPYIRVVSPIDGAPAARAGIRPGDLITALDGQSLKNASVNDIVARLRGAPGTSLTLTVQRKDTGKTEDLSLTRDIVRIITVKSAIIDNDIGYVRISAFGERTESRLLAAMDQLRTELGDNARGYIIDLRNNPGGLVLSGVDVADDFLDSGRIVSVGKGTDKDDVYNAYKGDTSNGKPIIVLVNEGTASAAEIVAGALQDRGRAIILGTPSFGKGSVQTIFPLSNGGALALTTAYYFTPSGRSIQGRGIIPDIRFVPARPPQNAQKRESDYKNALANPEPANDSRRTTGICKPASHSPAAPSDPDTVKPDGTPDYQLLCAVDTLRGTSAYTRTTPAPHKRANDTAVQKLRKTP